MAVEGKEAAVELSGEAGPVVDALRAVMAACDVREARFRSSNGRLALIIRCDRAHVDRIREISRHVKVRSLPAEGDHAGRGSRRDQLDPGFAGGVRVEERSSAGIRGRRKSLAIVPSAAFGTGHHPATQGCLVLVSRLLGSGVRVRDALDFGCGSGIIGLHIAKQSGCPVTFVDRSRVAMEALSRNARENRIHVPAARTGTSLDRLRGRRYDLVVSNLNLAEHRRVLPRLAATVRAGGILILGGLGRGHCSSLWESCRKFGLTRIRLVSNRGWTAVQLRKARGRVQASGRADRSYKLRQL